MKIVKILICAIVAVLTAAGIILGIALVEKYKPKYMQIAVTTLDDDIKVDLGKWEYKSTGHPDQYTCFAVLKDADGFKKSFEESEYFDKAFKLPYIIEENGRTSGDYYCFIKDNKLFSLTIFENIVELTPFQESLGSDRIAPIDIVIWDDENKSADNKSKTGIFKAESLNMDFLRALYGKLDGSYSKIEDGVIYLKTLEPFEIEEPSWSLEFKFSDDYTVKIYDDENGKVIVEAY